MPRKPLELPPAVARAFVKDMRAFHAEKNGARRDAIVAQQAWLLNQHLAKPVKIHEVKALFHEMKGHA
jgi:hypothetical protein